MKIAAARFELAIPGATSLKEKRSAVKSLKDRLLTRFSIAVAEVDRLGDPRRCTLGLCAVGNDAKLLRSVLDRVHHYVRNDVGVACLEAKTDIFPF